MQKSLEGLSYIYGALTRSFGEPIFDKADFIGFISYSHENGLKLSYPGMPGQTFSEINCELKINCCL